LRPAFPISNPAIWAAGNQSPALLAGPGSQPVFIHKSHSPPKATLKAALGCQLGLTLLVASWLLNPPPKKEKKKKKKKRE
jgi:hypothetical protein